MKPREEVKWVIRHRLEEQKALQSEIDAYMSFLDEQMDAMMLDKKVKDARIRFVLPTRMGEVVIRNDVAPESVEAAWRHIRA